MKKKFNILVSENKFIVKLEPFIIKDKRKYSITKG